MNSKNQNFIYILTNKNKTTLYIGVTSNLKKRMEEHLSGYGSSFAKKYKLTNIIYYEAFDTIELAILREKYLKGKTRKFKEDLIRDFNPGWKNLLDSGF
ncbi:MAG: GIY-YIG nuclease family protein [Bdellovibrionaceae bacterium]|nr:GIY-YIG nuclease family protein [Pseudobdellovibrionaceae bacterium]